MKVAPVQEASVAKNMMSVSPFLDKSDFISVVYFFYAEVLVSQESSTEWNSSPP